MVVSLCGAVPSQSVLTLAADEVGAVQIGLGGFLKSASERVPSTLSRMLRRKLAFCWVNGCACPAACALGAAEARMPYTPSATVQSVSKGGSRNTRTRWNMENLLLFQPTENPVRWSR